MNKTGKRDAEYRIAVDIEMLSAMLSCGHATARKIGEKAETKIIVGIRTLYLVDKVTEYLKTIVE